MEAVVLSWEASHPRVIKEMTMRASNFISMVAVIGLLCVGWRRRS